MHQVAVDIEQRLAVGALEDDVALPDLLEQGPRGGHALASLLGGGFDVVAEAVAQRHPTRRRRRGGRRLAHGDDLPAAAGDLPSRFSSASVWSQMR